MTRFAIVIPARYASTRYPGKPLAMLRGRDGHARPLIERSWRAAMSLAMGEAGMARAGVPGVEGTGLVGVWVATDDARIARAAGDFGAQVVMTSPQCRNGTERCAEALAQLPQVDVVVNFQGDAPLTPAHWIPDLVEALAARPDAAMATAAQRASAGVYAHLVRDAAQGRVGGTCALAAGDGRALYFSKRLLPFVPPDHPEPHRAMLLHLGLYAYRPQALRWYAAQPVSPLEALEGLEQLRFLEGEAPVILRVHDAPPWDCIELNNPQDVPAIEAILALHGMD